jgi:hypothetical protein
MGSYAHKRALGNCNGLGLSPTYRAHHAHVKFQHVMEELVEEFMKLMGPK